MTDEEKLEMIFDLAVSYAGVDGSHHKQYALVEIAKVIKGDDFDDWYEEFLGRDKYGDRIYCEWEEGTP